MNFADSKSAKRDPWALYDALIEGIPEEVCVVSWVLGTRWCYVEAECGMGVAMTLSGGTPSKRPMRPCGQPLREIAGLSKSWNMQDASLGVAALNAWYAQHSLLNGSDIYFEPLSSGDVSQGRTSSGHDSSSKDEACIYDPLKGLQPAMHDRDVCIIGHFPHVYDMACCCRRLTVLERKPTGLDLPDAACEYILPEQDFVISTGTTLANKTIVRLVELSADAAFVITGPSATPAPVLFDFGIDAMAGRVVEDIEQARFIIAGGNDMPFGSSIRRVAVYRPGFLEGLGLEGCGV